MPAPIIKPDERSGERPKNCRPEWPRSSPADTKAMPLGMIANPRRELPCTRYVSPCLRHAPEWKLRKLQLRPPECRGGSLTALLKRRRDIARMREGAAAKPALDQGKLCFCDMNGSKSGRQHEFA